MKEKHFINKSWTLFLDRDGVINQRPTGDYVQKVDDFIFQDGVLQAMAQLRRAFGRVIVVTNQQGVGKNLMTTAQVFDIHLAMHAQIRRNGGLLDAVYFCPHLASESCDCRKPKSGMALRAQKNFPEIDFQKSVMAGDTVSDMVFGKTLGMTTVFINSNQDFKTLADSSAIDFCCANLSEMAAIFTEESSEF